MKNSKPKKSSSFSSELLKIIYNNGTEEIPPPDNNCIEENTDKWFIYEDMSKLLNMENFDV